MSINFLKEDFRQFFIFLTQKKFTGLNFCALSLGLLFLPTPNYYQTVQARWQAPQTLEINFKLPLSSYPQNTTGISSPEVSAKGVLVMDVSSSVILFEKNSHKPFLPASTVKIMTALVVLESFNLENVITVPKLVDEGQDIKLKEGEEMTVKNLLYALLVASANDAAETLAASFPGGRVAFVQRMNEKAQELSLKETYFANPAGIDENGQYTSAFNLAVLTKYSLENSVFSEIVKTEKITLTSVDGMMIHEISNINQLLGRVEGVSGVKTGWTEEAGECLVTSIERDDRKLVIVVLGSQDRFGETEKLINWVFENFQWVIPT